MIDEDSGIAEILDILLLARCRHEEAESHGEKDGEALDETGEAEEELASIAQFALDTNGSALFFDDGLADIEAEACALVVLVYLGVAFEEFLLLVFGHTNASVLNVDLDYSCFLIDIAPSERDASFGSELEGVAEEVVDDLLGAGHVDVDYDIGVGHDEGELEV